jgi:Domain of unknown function (DUF1707)/Domain of unknown function (DUF4190)
MTGPSSRWPEPMGYPPAQPYRSMPVSPAMRAATADRERTVDVLKAAFAEGRLDQDEFNERMGLAYQARTYGDLVALAGDLPAGPLPVAMPPAWHGTRQRGRPATPDQHTNAMATAAFALAMLEFLTLGLTAIPAIICGHIANHQIKRTGERGAAMAGYALTFGYLALVIGVIVLLSHAGR